jgi:hypothetical protein
MSTCSLFSSEAKPTGEPSTVPSKVRLASIRAPNSSTSSAIDAHASCWVGL